jgi:hypothetical protein
MPSTVEGKIDEERESALVYGTRDEPPRVINAVVARPFHGSNRTADQNPKITTREFDLFAAPGFFVSLTRP